MSAIDGIKSAAYNLFVRDPAAYWLNKKDEDVEAVDGVKVLGLAVTLPIWGGPALIGLIAGCEGYVPTNEACSVSPKPDFPEYINPNKTRINEADLKKGVEITWATESKRPLLNCDGTTNNIKLVCKFKDGDLEVAPVDNGILKIVKTIKEPLSSAVKCDVVYTNPNKPDQPVTLENVVTLYGPEIIPESIQPAQCAQYPNPIIEPGFNIQPVAIADATKLLDPFKDIYVNQPFNVIFPVDAIKECDGRPAGANLAVTFMVDNKPNLATTDMVNYSYQPVFSSPGCRQIGLKVSDTSRKDIFSFLSSPLTVCANKPVVTAPKAGIVAPVVAKTGESVPFAATDPDINTFTYDWKFADGSTGNGPSVNHTYNLANGQMATFPVELTVARKDDPSVMDVTGQKITIVPVNVSAPSYKLNIPFAGPVKSPIPMSVDNLANPNDWAIAWEYGDGKTGSGLMVGNSYVGAGTYKINCTMTSKLDPNFNIYNSFTITIIPPGDPVPNLEVTPGQGKAPLNVTADASKSYAADQKDSIKDYLFNWGDGTIENGARASRPHPYIKVGTFTLRVTVTDSNGKTASISTVVSTWP